MASAFGHGVVAYALGTGFKSKAHGVLLLLGIVSAILPDIDILSFKFGIRYEALFGHRGFTHSIFFACVWSVLVSMAWNRIFSTSNFKTVLGYIFLCTLSHPILDALTTGGMGVAFFSPFSNERYFFPIRMIQVSPLSIEDFWGDWAWRVLRSEAIWIGIPSLILILINKFLLKKG